MRTAVDTNLFSVLWGDSADRERARGLLDRARIEGMLVLSPVVYAEMLANPAMHLASLHAFLEEARIRVDFELSPKVWQEAGRRFGSYAERRRRSGGGEARRLLADFVVGAHALVQADRLLTFDTARYRNDFPELTLMGEDVRE